MTARSRIRAALPWLVMLAGLAFLARPIALQWWEAWRASRGIDDVISTYDAMGDPERQALRAEARAYNEALATGGSLAARLPYERQLSYRGSEMIAYVEVPTCAIRLPIYHGTQDKALMAGVGHLKGTSLPVGGRSTHCVLTAHTGMPGRRMFDDIHLLEPGDEFVVWCLGEPLAYRVTGSEVVLPDETDSVAIVTGRDLCTLVTCTPYGVNSHRLLVHAERCAYEDGGAVADLAVYVNNRTAPLLVALCALLALGASLLRRRRAAKRGPSRFGEQREPKGTVPVWQRGAAGRHWGQSPLAHCARQSGTVPKGSRLPGGLPPSAGGQVGGCRPRDVRAAPPRVYGCRAAGATDVSPPGAGCRSSAIGDSPPWLISFAKEDSPQRLPPAGMLLHWRRAAKRGLSPFGEQREPKGTVPFGSPEQPTCHAS